MIDSIHQSYINTLFRCGERFRRRYIEGERIPPGIAAQRGSSVHITSEVNLTQKITSGVDLPLSDMKDSTRDSYVYGLQENGVYLCKEDRSAKRELVNTGLNEALSCITIYANEVAPTINPMAVEETFRHDIGVGLPIAGKIDYEEPAWIIGDLKTSVRAWSQQRAESEIQPKMYSLAYEIENEMRPLFHYDILTPNKPVQKINIQVPDNRVIFNQIRIFMKAYTAGVFLPAQPGSWWCSARW